MPADDSVAVSYTCPHCGAVHVLHRPPVLADRSVTPDPRPHHEYASLTDPQREAADGIVLVCGVDDPLAVENGCGRQFYLNFVRHQAADETTAGGSLEDPPRFDFK